MNGTEKHLGPVGLARRAGPVYNQRTMKPKVLLHMCCAPDATAAYERLAPEYEVVGYFHNDNIYPPEEFELRRVNAEKTAAVLGFRLEPAEYQPAAWDRAVAGLESEPERGRRCEVCFRHNLAAAAAKAKALGIPFFTTTLTISPHKSSALLCEIGRTAAAAHGVQFLALDFKKRDGFKRSLELSRQLGLYRQNYCGCRYSKR
jgi:epoxyqueuosine reductase